MLLRHKPERAKLTLDKEGWCDLIELFQNTDFTIDEIEEIVRTDNKQRYSLKYQTSFSEGLSSTREPTHIRANQGHSTSKVQISFRTVTPPLKLFHGTSQVLLPTIMKSGLKPMSRHHVHLSKTIDVAEAVGARRRGEVLILEIDAATAYADGVKFFISENGVYLTDFVHPKYIKELI